ncbi:MAG: hypothetical protein N2652_04405 [Kiritimatiellae bacterium]|nr:hypothetical protein [Kiritimatiellia bacterium]
MITLYVPAVDGVEGMNRVLKAPKRVFHEKAQWRHFEGPAWYRRGVDPLFVCSRRRGEPLVRSFYGKTYRDKWYQEYCGDHLGREAVTRHLQLFGNPPKMKMVMAKEKNSGTIAKISVSRAGYSGETNMRTFR